MAFCSNSFDQKIQMLTQLEKLSKWFTQLKFLFLCRNHGAIPKGLQLQIPRNIVVKSISEIYNKKYNAVRKIAGVKVKSRETNQRDKETREIRIE